MPFWTDLERARLLLAMVELLVPPNKLPSWAEVAEKMGAGFTQDAIRQQYQKLRKEGIQTTGFTSTPNTPQRDRVRASQPTRVTKSPTRRGRPRGKRALVDHHQFDDGDGDSDARDGKKKKIKREAGQSEYQPRTILKIEPVDEDGVVDLEEDELSI